MVQSDCCCIRECFNTCCVNPLALPQPHTSASASASASTATVDPRRSFVSAILSSIQPNANFTNHESLPSLTDLLSSLKNAVPNYLNTVVADSIRDQEYRHLSQSNRVFLDYVGHGLFSHAQKHTADFHVSYTSVKLNSHLMYGNQESAFQTSIRKRIMRYMNVFEDDYSSVFTANQSSAFNILADSYPFHSNPNLLTVYDYQNDAVETMIERAKSRGGGGGGGCRHHSAIFSWPNLRVNSRKLRKIILVGKGKGKGKNRAGLLVFPLQSRTSGARYPYQWMNLARDNGWHVLLDASALGAKEMETLGLSLFQPDFIICSFFKIFGENPSGFCCLFIKKSSVSDLSQSSTSMGIVSLNEQKSEEEASSSEIVETHEGIAECRGLDHADTLGLILISSRVRYLVNWLVNALLSLKHPHSGNGLSLITIYGPRIKLDRGPAVAFNVYDWKGERVDPILVQKLADRNNISLTLAFLKNVYFSEDFQDVLENTRGENKRRRRSKEGCGVRVVSVSLGMLSNFEDIYRVWAFVSRFLDADFVEKERWRYTALNQTTVEV